MREFRLSVANKPGELARIAELLGQQEINILGFAGLATTKTKSLVTLVTSDDEKARSALRSAKLKFESVEALAVTVEDKPGELGRVCRKLADAGVNIETSYVIKEGDQFKILFTVNNPRKAKSALGIGE